MRILASVGWFCLAMAVAVAPATAEEADSAWSRSGGPLPALAFVAPGQEESPAIVQANSLASGGMDDAGRGGILSEVRLGVLGFWQQNSSSEDGVYLTGQILFDPFVQPFDNWILNTLLRPRPHVGGTASPWGTDQFFAGLTWTVPIGRLFFAEASFGGTIHDGPLENAQVALGCRVLFRESASVGVNLGERWRLLAGVDHSSHANLCGGENDGLTHIGGSIGYRF